MFGAKRFAGVRLFALTVAAGAFSGFALAPVAERGIVWKHGAPVGGHPVTVSVEGSTCMPVTVTLMIDGDEVGEVVLTEVPGNATFAVPLSSAGKPYRLLVKCASESVSDSGMIL